MTRLLKTVLKYLFSVKESIWLVQEPYSYFYLKLLGLLLFVEGGFEWSQGVGSVWPDSSSVCVTVI